MTETTCPTCGQKCDIDTITNHEGEIIKEWFEKGRESVKRTNKSGCCCMFEEDESISIMCAAHREVCPDLTKLREAYHYFTLMRSESDSKRDMAINELIWAVKELLEENK